VIYLDLDDILYVAQRVLPTVEVRDIGLLESALARPRATAYGAEAYRDLHAKAAALLHSVANDHALLDGNKRLALAAVVAFLGVNGHRLTVTNDEAYELVVAVAAGELRDVDVICEPLRAGSAERRARGR
jgi:death on curing protein